MCYNVIMVKQKQKVITKIILAVASLSTTLVGVKPIFAEETANTTFQVNVKESITVSITTPVTGATGDMDEFLRNQVDLSVNTNNVAGFTASMTMKTTETALKNGANSLPTLTTSSTRGSFPANYWGYSLDDTLAGSATSNYAALVSANATPITILTSNSSSGSRTFYFGAKGNSALPSGTYNGTVVVSVVSGVIDDTTNPITPTNPVKPSTYDVATYQPAPAGGSSNGATYYATSSTTGDRTTTTTEVSDGDNRAAYVSPLGELYDTYTGIVNGSLLATALAITASVAATSGVFFFALAKRDDDDEDEDGNQENYR